MTSRTSVRSVSARDEWFFSEEAWTKSKNWARRLLLLVVFSGCIAAAVFGVAASLNVRLVWSDLERHYLNSYLWAASPRILSSTGTYTFVIVTTPQGRDHLAGSADVALRRGHFVVTAAGRKHGAITAGERQYPDVSHAEAYWTLREYVYGGRSCWQLLRTPGWIGAVVFAVLVWRGATRDHEDRRLKHVGSIEQGPGLVTAEEFNRVYRGDGIGLHVKRPTGNGAIQIRIPKAYEPQSAVVLGDTGAGKTVALQQLIDHIQDRGDIAVVHDPKAAYLPIYFNAMRGDIVLNPFDVRSPFWNPADEVSSEHDIETVAAAFFPDMPGKDVFWTESPRKLMTVFLSRGLSAGEMVRLFENESLIDGVVAGSRYASLIDPKSPSQRSGVLSELTKLAQVLQWLPEKADTKRAWSAAQWTTAPEGWLFLTSRADQSSALQTLYAIWLELLITRCLAKRFERRLWFIIDELPVLRHIPNLQKLITLGRECNIPLIMGLQGRAQLDERYGQNGAEVILSQPVTKIFLRTSEPKAAKWISDSIGSQALERMREGVTAGVQDWRDSVNYTPERRIEPAVLDSVIASLPNLRGYFKFLEHVVEIEYVPEDRPARAEPVILRPPRRQRRDAVPPTSSANPEDNEKTPKPKIRLLG